jgi:ornithine decarboxylase
MISRAKFVFSKKAIVEEYTKINSICDSISYSVKSNPFIVPVLEEKTNSLFLIHHINELQHIKDKKRIWFMLHSPEKEELDTLFKENVNKYIVDNINDLNFLEEYLKKENKKIELLLRMRLKEYTVQTGRYFVYGFFSKDINELIPKLKNNQAIEKLGIHFHRKTQNLSEWNLVEELEESISPDTWKDIDCLDIGGGIPVDYKNVKAETIKDVYKKISELKAFVNKKNIKLIIEPGRAIAGPSGKLITTIKNIVDDNIFIDASVFNCAMDVIVANIKLLVENELEETDKQAKAYVIKGLTPASEDIFRYRVYLKEPKVGDKLIFLNAGAYIYYTDLFNLERPKIILEE